MSAQGHWVFPEGIEEVLPPFAQQLDWLCRDIIDLYTTWGYQLVIPPIIEYLDSLLTGTGKDLELQMFKLTDQLNGRLMGIRADITPQVARIDAYNMRQESPTRLCYLGPVLRTLPEHTGSNRCPLQVGGELYGHKGIESDIEIFCLMVETIKMVGLKNIHIDFGHASIYKTLVELLKIEGQVEEQLFSVLQRKSLLELNNMMVGNLLSEEAGEIFTTLIKSNGSASELQQNSAPFKNLPQEIQHYIDELQRIVVLASQRMSDVQCSFDLCELHGYRYHTGITFTAYVPNHGSGIAFGGRYDGIGSAFGRSRPATGFSTDINTIMSLCVADKPRKMAIYAPCSDAANQLEAINNLRSKGEIVICELSGQKSTATEIGCDRQLVLQEDRWVVKSFSQ